MMRSGTSQHISASHRVGSGNAGRCCYVAAGGTTRVECQQVVQCQQGDSTSCITEEASLEETARSMWDTGAGQRRYPLHEAAASGAAEVVLDLLSDGFSVDVREQDDRGWTALHHAAFHSHTDVMKVLLNQPDIKIDAACKSGDTPLGLAALKHNRKAIRLLLQHGASPQLVQHPQDAAYVADVTLQSATQTGTVSVTAPSGRRTAGQVKQPTKASDTRLRQACTDGQAKAVRKLVQQGADIHAADVRGWQPLHHAALKGHEDVVTLLLQEGALPDTPTAAGETALSLAALTRKGPVCRALLAAGASWQSVTDASDKAYLVRLLGQEHAGPEGSEHSATLPYRPTMPDWDARTTVSEPEPSGDVVTVGSLVQYRQPRKAGGGVRMGVVLEVLAPAGDEGGPRDPDAPAIGPLVVRDLAAGTLIRVAAGRVQQVSAKEAQDWLAKHGQSPTELQQVPSPSGAPTSAHADTAAHDQRPARPTTAPRTHRRAAVMYLPCGQHQGTHQSVSRGYAASVFSSRSGAAPVWKLHELPTPGMTAGRLVVDPETELVYCHLPTVPEPNTAALPATGSAHTTNTITGQSHSQQQPSSAQTSEGGYSNDSFVDSNATGPRSQRVAQDAPDPATVQHTSTARAKPALPVLIGRLCGRLNADGSPAAGASVAPLTVDDVLVVERCRNALRSLRRNNAAAEALMRAARKGTSGSGSVALLADLCTEVGAGPQCEAVSLAVPLCAVLGVSHIGELRKLTERNLKACGVDSVFLSELVKLGATQPTAPTSSWMHTATTMMSAGTAGEALQAQVASSMLRRSLVSQAEHHTGKWSPPALLGFLAAHGLLKLLPLAAEMGLLHSRAVARWHHLCEAAENHLPMHNPELRRLAALRHSIAAVQEQRMIMKVTRSLKLTRVGEGSLVLYEAQTHRGKVSGGRLVGIVLSAIPAKGQTVGGWLLTIRDLLDDSKTTLSPGQVTHVSRSEAGRYLRADLLPPATPGVPVTPLSAAHGLLVQLVSSWSSAGAGAAAIRSADADSELESKLVIGKLVRPAGHVTEVVMVTTASGPMQASAAEAWVVQWPDGSETEHPVGKDGVFALAHLHVHRLQGAPLKNHHLTPAQVLPVVRSPVWPYGTTDDVVPGSLGLAQARETQGSVTVLWSRARGAKQPTKQYEPNAEGVFPLCHGLLSGQPVHALNAKPEVLVEPSGVLEAEPLKPLGKAGPGRLAAPVAWYDGKVVWQVVWPDGTVTECAFGGLDSLSTSPLKVSAKQMELPGVGAVPLNEVGVASTPGGPLGVAVINTVASVIAARCSCSCGQCAGGEGHSTTQMGRSLFLRPNALAPRDGMLGMFVKLNREADLLQPYCLEGPMRAHVPRTPAEVLDVVLNGGAPAPLDDIGWVVRDAGAGQWRGLLVRMLGTTQAFWYDEAVLLPADESDIQKQVTRRSQEVSSYVLPIDNLGVPVTDANAAPGMLVKRAYTRSIRLEADVHEGRDRANMIGELVAPAGEHAWVVAWRDGTRGRYRTGLNGRFQLCHVNIHDDAGAPLQAQTVSEMFAQGFDSLPVTDGVHCSVVTAVKHRPGQVRVLALTDQGTMQGTSQESQTQSLTTKDIPRISVEERQWLLSQGIIVDEAVDHRYLGGGPLALFELSHAIRARDPVTVFNAKPGLRVQRAAEIESSTPKVGMLLRPVRLGLQARLKETDSSGQPVEWLNAAECWWDVAWEDGLVTQMPVGTLPDHTPLRVALGGGIRNQGTLARALRALDKEMGQVSQKCENLIKGYSTLRLQDRLLAMVAQVQLSCTEQAYYEIIEEASVSADDEDDEANEVQAYEHIKYLQLVERHKVSLERMHLAKEGVLLTREMLQQLGPGCWPSDQAGDSKQKLEDLKELSEDAGSLLASRLPQVIRSILKASMDLSNKSCLNLLKHSGDLTKFERDWVATDEIVEDEEVIKESTQKTSETAIALDICWAKLADLQAMVPKDSFYAEAIEDMVTQARGQVALACASTACEWSAAACVPLLRLLDSAATSEDLIIHSELVTAVMDQLLAATRMSIRMRGCAEPESSITPKEVSEQQSENANQDWAAHDLADLQKDAAENTQQAADCKAEETDGGNTGKEEAAATANDQLSTQQIPQTAAGTQEDEQPPEQGATASGTADGVEPANAEPPAPPKTVVTVPEAELTLQAIIMHAVDLLHRACNIMTQQLHTLPAASQALSEEVLNSVQTALAVGRILDILNSNGRSIADVLETAIPDRLLRDKAAAKLQLVARAAESARNQAYSRAESIASKQTPAQPAATRDSVLAAAYSKLTAGEASGELAGQWAVKACGLWSGVQQGYDKALDAAGRTAAAAVAKADNVIAAVAEALKDCKGEAATALQEELAEAEVAKKQAQTDHTKAEQALRRWLAEQAYVCCYALASDWAYKGLDDVNTVYDLTVQDACHYFALSEAKQKLNGQPATAGTPQPGVNMGPGNVPQDAVLVVPEPLYPGDKTMMALHALVTPLREANALVRTAKKHGQWEELETAFHDVFKAVANVVYERYDRFTQEIDSMIEDFEDILANASSEEDPEEGQVRRTPEMVVAQAYGLVYVARDSLAMVSVLIDLVPHVSPRKDQVLDKLKEGRESAPQLLARAQQLERMYDAAHEPGAFKAWADGHIQIQVAIEERRTSKQATAADETGRVAVCGLHRVPVHMTQDPATGSLAVRATVTGLPKVRQQSVQEALEDGPVTELLEPIETLGKRIVSVRGKLKEAVGTSWSPTTLALQQRMKELEAAWRSDVQHACSRMPVLQLW